MSDCYGGIIFRPKVYQKSLQHLQATHIMVESLRYVVFK